MRLAFSITVDMLVYAWTYEHTVDLCRCSTAPNTTTVVTLYSSLIDCREEISLLLIDCLGSWLKSIQILSILLRWQKRWWGSVMFSCPSLRPVIHLASGLSLSMASTRCHGGSHNSFCRWQTCLYGKLSFQALTEISLCSEIRQWEMKGELNPSKASFFFTWLVHTKKLLCIYRPSCFKNPAKLLVSKVFYGNQF